MTNILKCFIIPNQCVNYSRVVVNAKLNIRIYNILNYFGLLMIMLWTSCIRTFRFYSECMFIYLKLLKMLCDVAEGPLDLTIIYIKIYFIFPVSFRFL